jgi:uroporphyrinogen decarboxylase
MISREIVLRTIEFRSPERMALNFPAPYTDDLLGVSMNPSPDRRYSKGIDEWGCEWDNIGVCNLGEVKDFPLKSWDDFKNMNIPDIKDEARWKDINEFDKSKTDKFVISSIMSHYERCHFLRSLEEFWADLYDNPNEVKSLLRSLTDMNLYAIERYAKAGSDGIMFCDDWGLQNTLMISPKQWREFFKPFYAEEFKLAHELGLKVFMHSCGYVLEILDDLVEIGLDVAQFDQQLNMGLDELGKYKGKLTFWCPVDIQTVMPNNDVKEIRAYANEMVNKIASVPQGGFIAKIYPDPKAVGHEQESVDEMCKEFEKISNNWK